MLDDDEDDDFDGRIATLVSLAGPDACERLLSSFVDQLERLLAPDADGALSAEAHRLAGLSGMIGLRRLEAACRTLEDHPTDASALHRTRAAMEAAKAALGKRLRPPPPA